MGQEEIPPWLHRPSFYSVGICFKVEAFLILSIVQLQTCLSISRSLEVLLFMIKEYNHGVIISVILDAFESCKIHAITWKAADRCESNQDIIVLTTSVPDRCAAANT